MQYLGDLADAAYKAKVLSAIVQARADGAETLTAICRRTRGAFPVIVSALLKELPGGPSIAHRSWRDEEPGMYDSALPSMPEPHPVDYEWRYTAETAEELSSYLLSSRTRIACFGTPTVFWRLRHSEADVRLFDRNMGLLQSLNPNDAEHLQHVDLLEADAATSHPDGISELYDSILLDPPWYVDHTLAWIHRALRLLRPGGKLVLTLFPDLVRPRAGEERVILDRLLAKLGRVHRLPFSALYTTPLFEHETLSAFGLADLGQWRRGELVSVKVVDPSQGVNAVNPIEVKWAKVQLGTQVIAVRDSDGRTAAAGAPLVFEPPEPDGSLLLKTVSARDPVRRQITVWTSRNRALIAKQGASHILPFLKRLEAGQSAAEALNLSPPDSRGELRILLSLVGW